MWLLLCSPGKTEAVEQLVIGKFQTRMDELKASKMSTKAWQDFVAAASLAAKTLEGPLQAICEEASVLSQEAEMEELLTNLRSTAEEILGLEEGKPLPAASVKVITETWKSLEPSVLEALDADGKARMSEVPDKLCSAILKNLTEPLPSSPDTSAEKQSLRGLASVVGVGKKLAQAELASTKNPCSPPVCLERQSSIERSAKMSLTICNMLL